jgi:hypothetical protein
VKFYRSDKRGFIRMDTEAEISYSPRGGGSVRTGLTRNLSHTGLQFETGEAPARGAVLDVEIRTVDGKFAPMRGRLVVIRVEPLENGRFLVAGKLQDVK